jgi:hypothetical protein
MPTQEDAGWMEGRVRPVRFVLTEEEHALLRQAAALMDKSVSRSAIELAIEGARRVVSAGGAPGPAPQPPQDKPKAKKPRRPRGV